ncbi:MAG: hypothetical protein ACK55Z_08225, partial [bacterium]
YLEKGPVKTSFFLTKSSKDEHLVVYFVCAIFYFQFYHVGFVEVQIVWLHELTLLNVSKLFAIQVIHSAEVRTEFGQRQ